jgi:hypothetical protein
MVARRLGRGARASVAPFVRRDQLLAEHVHAFGDQVLVVWRVLYDAADAEHGVLLKIVNGLHRLLHRSPGLIALAWEDGSADPCSGQEKVKEAI